VRATARTSRSVGSAVHLRECRASALVSIVTTTTELERKHELGAPTLDDTREHHLLGVIGNESNKVIYNTPEMSIWTSADNRCGHPRLERGENCCEGRMKQLAFENPKMQVVVMPAVTCQ
jgi:hypothetical protein